MKLLDRIEKLLLGYTAAERAEIQRRFVDWRIEQVIVGSLERLQAEDDAEDAEDAEAAQDEDESADEDADESEAQHWHDLHTGKPVAEHDLPPVVRAFAQRVSAAYDGTAEPKPKTPAQEGEARP